MLPILLLTLRALGRGRRLLVIAVLLAVPALVSLAYVASQRQPDGLRFAIDLFNNLLLPVLLPVTAVIFGTTALGSEIEDRTLIYLTLRPVSRLAIVLGKWLAATLITLVLVELSLVVMYVVATWRHVDRAYLVGSHLVRQGAVLGPILLAGLGGCVAYCSLFLLLGQIWPRRALIGGFVYVLGWEGLAAGLSTALATFSVRRYVQGTLDAGLGDSPLAALLPSSLSGGACAAVLAAIAIGGIAATTFSLRRLELP